MLSAVSPDILNPRSTDLERAYALEDVDRMIVHPEIFDPQETGKVLLNNNPILKKDSEKYLVKAPVVPPQMPPDQMGGGAPMPSAGNSPLNAMGKKSPLSTGNAATSIPGLK